MNKIIHLISNCKPKPKGVKVVITKGKFQGKVGILYKITFDNSCMKYHIKYRMRKITLLADGFIDYDYMMDSLKEAEQDIIDGKTIPMEDVMNNLHEMINGDKNGYGK